MAKEAYYLTANGNTTPIDWPADPEARHEGNLTADGTFGSGTLKLQLSHDNGSTWTDADATNLAFTENKSMNFNLPACKIRLNLSGSTNPNLNVWISHLGK